MLFGSIWTGLFTTLFVIALLLVVGLLVMVIKCWRKVQQGTALIVTGGNRPTVHFSKAIVWPLIRQTEIMDISVKRIEIFRHGSEGLICKDNVRADIKVAFFVRVNNTEEDVLKVAQSIGVKRASQQSALVELFDAKFSEALKTVGKQFNFVDLYTERDTFKDRILQTIGRDLNGYILDDCAIDYLEQTPMEKLDPQNILDSEGIKKITDLTARQQVLANHISREKEKTITKQNVEAREAILELERQQAEAEQKQKREIAAVVAREEAEAARIEQEERLRAEQARIRVEEELAVAEQNKLRQILVAQRNKERTDKVEIERVERDRLLEVTERDRVVSLAEIEKEKAIEVEKKAIQDVIRERVMVERAVVEEEEKI
ncbi:MAG TPA: flotillin family protein, partial [Planctomycetaceae bacterium]|nr:flotillin family protein [Planctomycetaceae bacterium]